MGVRFSLKHGEREKQLSALSDFSQSSLFNDSEKATLAYAEAMTQSDQEVTDSIFASLKNHYDDGAIVELTGLIAFQNMSSKCNAALNLPAQGFCRINFAEDREG